MDEARVGQKGRTGHRWWIKGERPPGLCDKRFASAYIFAAVRPATGEDFALVLPRVCTEAINRFLTDFAETVPADTHAVLALDGAGWHDPRSVTIPPNVTLVTLPPYRPELNPVERIWLYLRERYLSHRLHADYHDVVDACCRAWNALTAEVGRIQTLCSYPTWPGSGHRRGGIISLILKNSRPSAMIGRYGKSIWSRAPNVHSFACNHPDLNDRFRAWCHLLLKAHHPVEPLLSPQLEIAVSDGTVRGSPRTPCRTQPTRDPSKQGAAATAEVTLSEAGQRRGKSKVDVFPDQGAKLVYLITIHGDRRRPDPKRPAYAEDDNVTWKGHHYQSPLAVTQAALAIALAVDPARVTAWRHHDLRIPPFELRHICRIFAVDEIAFRTSPFAEFVETTRRPAASDRALALSLPWRHLIRDHASSSMAVFFSDPAETIASTGSPRFRHPTGRGLAGPADIPEVEQGAPFWIGLTSPLGDDEAIWANWHLTLLSLDRSFNSFACLYPGEAETGGYGTGMFPPH